MLRSIGSILGGYLTMLFLSVFPRVVFAFYHRSDSISTGFSPESPAFWNYILVGFDLFAATFAALITATVSKKNEALHLLGLSLVLVPEGIYLLTRSDFAGLYFFSISSWVLKAVGIFVGYKIYIKMKQA